MKKAWNEIKSFITVATIFLWAYCIIFRIPIDDTLKTVLATVIGFFLGSKIPKDGDE